MELMVVMGVFSMTVMMTSAIFAQTNRVQRRVLGQTAAQSDLRFVLEALVREIRMGRVDYDFYSRAGGVTVPVDRLVVRNAAGEREEFFLSSDGSVCPATSPKCLAMSLNGGEAESMTSGAVAVDRLVIYVTPAADPFAVDPASGDYLADGQPTVTVALRVRSLGGKPEDSVTMDAQMTVSTRTYVR